MNKIVSTKLVCNVFSPQSITFCGAAFTKHSQPTIQQIASKIKAQGVMR